MSDKPGLLKNIREQIAARNSGQPAAPKCPKCPKCDHDLTIEYMAYFTSEICENCFDHVRVHENKDCCVDPRYHAVKLITASGSIQVKEQCQTCGNVKTAAVGGYSKEQKEKLPLLDDEFRQIRYTRSSEQYRAAHRKLQEAKTLQYEQKKKDRRAEWMGEYSKYLNSPEWLAKRELVLKRDNRRCQCCLDSFATQVHHKSYEFEDLTGAVPAFDLISVCGPCHDRIEAMKAEKRKSNNP